MANGPLLKLDASQHALVLLEANLVLPIALMLLVKLKCQGTKLILGPMLAQMFAPMAAAQDLESCVLS